MMAKGKILIIEDSPENRYLVTFLLEHYGYDVTTASTGPEGLLLAGSINPDIILLDVQLPGMDGYEVARALKSNPLLKSVPVIAVTAYAMAGDREKFFVTGIEGYIEKPINPETFAQEIEQFIVAHSEEIKP